MLAQTGSDTIRTLMWVEERPDHGPKNSGDQHKLGTADLSLGDGDKLSISIWGKESLQKPVGSQCESPDLVSRCEQVNADCCCSMIIWEEFHLFLTPGDGGEWYCGNRKLYNNEEADPLTDLFHCKIVKSSSCCIWNWAWVTRPCCLCHNGLFQDTVCGIDGKVQLQ